MRSFCETIDDFHRGREQIRTRRYGVIEIADGSLRALAGIAGRRIYVHINNTNPVLVDGSPERLEVERAGWEIAEDGMEVVL